MIYNSEQSEGNDSENPIVLVTNYDYLGFDKGGKYKGIYENGSSIASILEIAKKLSEHGEKPEKAIVFAFINSLKLKSKGASIFSLNKLMDRNTFYFYLNYFGLSTKDDNIYIDTSLITSSTKEAYSYVKYVKDRSDELGMNIFNDQLTVNNDDVSKFKIDGASGILIDGIRLEQTYQYSGMRQDQIVQIDKQKLKKQAQLIIDTIVYIAY